MQTLRALAIGSTLVLASSLATAASEDATERPAVPSVGCDGSALEADSDRDSTLRVGDLDRTWDMHLPDAYDGTAPLPVWIQLHGCCGDTGSEEVSRLSATADEHGFVLVGPDSHFGNGDWTYDSGTSVLDASKSNPDVAFIDALIDHLGAELCIDMARLYTAGFSAGGDGASVLACTLEDRIAAVATASGVLDMDGVCDLQRPVPFLSLHGKDDNIVFLDGGLASFFNDWPVIQAMAQDSIPDRVSSFALRNGCEAQPIVVPTEDGMEHRDWTCLPGAEVALVLHDGGHEWPDEAADIIWEFFRQHPMPE
jgi:polyhydroxybutyrate depolymerase